MEASTKVLVKGNLISLIRNPFSSAKKGISMLRNRASIAGGFDTSILSALDNNSPITCNIEQKLNLLKMPQPIAGNIDYLIDGAAFFNALETSINSAQKTIDTRVFIFDNDDENELADLRYDYGMALKATGEYRTAIEEFNKVISLSEDEELIETDVITCDVCFGQRLNEKALNVTVGDKNIVELASVDLSSLSTFFEKLKFEKKYQHILLDVMNIFVPVTS